MSKSGVTRRHARHVDDINNKVNNFKKELNDIRSKANCANWEGRAKEEFMSTIDSFYKRANAISSSVDAVVGDMRNLADEFQREEEEERRRRAEAALDLLTGGGGGGF